MQYLTPPQIASAFCKSAHTKNAFSVSKLFCYSVLGGAFIALGGLLSLVVVGGMPTVVTANPGIGKLLFGSLFPLGLILVVIGGAELFTSDCAVIPFAVINKQLKAKSIAKIWTIVYTGNFVGALVVAYFFAIQTGLLQSNPWHDAAVKLAVHKTEGSFWVTFIKGVGANWLVCMAVWLSYAAKDVISKIIAIWFPVMCFVAFGMEHSIANMFFIPTAMWLNAPINMYQFIVVNLIPATLGNIVGGVLMVAIPYWYMFKEDINKDAIINALTTNNDSSTASNVANHIPQQSFSNQLN